MFYTRDEMVRSRRKAPENGFCDGVEEKNDSDSFTKQKLNILSKF